MASAEREPVMGVWGLCPHAVHGHGPRPGKAHGQGVGGRSLPGADEFLANETHILQ